MVSMSLQQHGHALTRADLDAMPDDGRRYELLDGALIVTPSPARVHQLAVFHLNRILNDACPSHLLVGTSPTDIALADDTSLQPDLFVVERGTFLDLDISLAPLLVVEVLSPSTRRIDLTVKKSRYEEAGCPSYWTVDPATPSVTLWTMSADRYGVPRRYVADEEVSLTSPFELAFTPRDLTT